MDDLLTYRHVTVCYGKNRVVKDVSFSLKEGEILGIVGESGSGKSTLLLAAMGLLGRGGCVTRGDIYFRQADPGTFTGTSAVSEKRNLPTERKGGLRQRKEEEFHAETTGLRDLPDLRESELRTFRGKELSMISQDPGASLCPVRKIVDLAYEAGRAHDVYGRGRKEKRRCAADLAELFETFGLEDPEHILAAYPFELSGGMLQRAVIAMTLLLDPSVILADEPTSALDVVSASLVAEELARVRKTRGTAVLLVTHNLALAARVTDRLLILKDGVIQETGKTADVLKHPESPYTKELLEAVPKLERRTV